MAAKLASTPPRSRSIINPSPIRGQAFPVSADTGDSLEAKRALLLKIRMERKKLESQLGTHSVGGGLLPADTEQEDVVMHGTSAAASSTACAMEEDIKSKFAALIVSRSRAGASGAGSSFGAGDEAAERELQRITRLNTLHNSHSLVTFDLPDPEDFERQERFLQQVGWCLEGPAQKESLRMCAMRRIIFCYFLILLFLVPRKKVDAMAGQEEGPAPSRPTSRVKWSQVLCFDEPAPVQEAPVAAPRILRARPEHTTFPYADCLHPQRVKVLPKLRGSRRGSALLDSPVGLQELLASNRVGDGF